MPHCGWLRTLSLPCHVNNAITGVLLPPPPLCGAHTHDHTTSHSAPSTFPPPPLTRPLHQEPVCPSTALPYVLSPARPPPAGGAGRREVCLTAATAGGAAGTACATRLSRCCSSSSSSTPRQPSQRCFARLQNMSTSSRLRAAPAAACPARGAAARRSPDLEDGRSASGVSGPLSALPGWGLRLPPALARSLPSLGQFSRAANLPPHPNRSTHRCHAVGEGLSTEQGEARGGGTWRPTSRPCTLHVRPALCGPGRSGLPAPLGSPQLLSLSPTPPSTPPAPAASSCAVAAQGPSTRNGGGDTSRAGAGCAWPKSTSE